MGCSSTINTGVNNNNLTNNNNNQAMISQNDPNGSMQIFNDNIQLPYANYFDYANSREIGNVFFSVLNDFQSTELTLYL